MAYVEGRSLAAKLRDEGPMPPKEAAALVRKIADAVQYAHLKGVVHRDLKPGNVLLDINGEPRVTDFGLAKQVDTDSELTASGQVLGTPSYMPPEQAAGKLSDIGPASDIYSLGAILYACLTGRPPFQGASPTDVILQVLNDTPPAPRTLNRKVDRDLNTIVMKCLDKPIGARYENAAHLRVDLDNYLRGWPIQARPIGRIARTWRWSKRHKAVSVLLAALMISLFYPLIVGLTEVWANRGVIQQLLRSAAHADSSFVAGYSKRIEMVDEEGNVLTKRVMVYPGVRSERLDEIENAVELACDKAVVLRFQSGRDGTTASLTGGRLKVWIENEYNGKSPASRGWVGILAVQREFGNEAINQQYIERFKVHNR